MKKKLALCLLVLCGLQLTGCAEDKKVEENTLFVKTEGKVYGAVVDTLDKDYFDKDELEQWVEDSIDAYNKEYKKGSLKLRKLKVADKKVQLSIQYASMEDYERFNQVTAFEGTIKEAMEAGYVFDEEYKSTADKPAITQKEIKDSKEYRVLILEEGQQLELDRNILYVNDAVEVDGKNLKKAKVNAIPQKLAFIIYK